MKQVLKHAEFYKLCEFIKTQKSPIVASYTGLAMKASQELGFDVPANAVKNAIKSTGVSFVPSVKRVQNFKGTDRIVRLASAILGVAETIEKNLGPMFRQEDKQELQNLIRRKGVTK